MAHLLQKYLKNRVDGFFGYVRKTSIFSQKRRITNSISNFWKITQIFERCQKMVHFMPNIAPKHFWP